MNWDEDAREFGYRTTFNVIVRNDSDAFTKITSLIGDSKVDVENIRQSSFNFRTRLINCIVWARCREDLDELGKAIISFSFVKSVNRNS